MSDDDITEPLPSDELPNRAKRGRGAVGNPAGRFERYAGQALDDGWLNPADDETTDKDERQLTTHLHLDTSRKVISYIDTPDMPADMRSVNPYRGCEHGCIYCYARPSHSYLGFSAGTDFETEILHKPDAPEILRKEIGAAGYKMAPITLSGNTDCYQPMERKLGLTRRILEVMQETQHPFGIITKSALVLRDLDIIAPMAALRLAHVSVSVTTLDADLARVMEPRAATPSRRLATIRALAAAGVPVTVMAAPLIPGLTDMETEKILEAARDAGARWAHYTVVRLPYEIKDLFGEWLQTHRPERAAHVLSLIRDMRGGKLYDATLGQRRTGTGPIAELIGDRFRLACKRLGLNQARWNYDLTRFKPPRGDARQMQLFG